MKHIKKTNGGTLQWDKDDWVAGLGPQGSFTTQSFTPVTEVQGFSYLKNLNPFALYGAAYPGYDSGANATNNANLAGVFTSLVLKDNTVGYGLDAGGKVHTYTTSTNTLSAAHTIAYAAGSTYVGQDAILYKHNLSGTPTVSMFYSAYNSNNFDVGTVGISSGTYDDDFMSSTPATPLDITSGDGDDTTQRTAPHPMEIGQDDLLYIGSGRYIHGYDGALGTNGTFYSKVLTLPLGFQVVAMKKFQNLFLIVGNYYQGTTSGVGEAQLYTWNYTDSDISSVTPLEDYTVTALFSWNGSPTVITQGVPARNGGNKIKVISGSSVTKVADFNGTAPTNRGIQVINDIIYMNAGGKILAMGNSFKKSFAINHLFTTSATGTSGALLYVDLITGFIASAGTSQCVNAIYSNNGAGTCEIKTFFDHLDLPYNKLGRVTDIYVRYANPLVAGGTNGTFSLFLSTDNTTQSATIINALSSVAIPLKKRYGLTTSSGVLPTFSSVGFFASWAASTAGASPAIVSIEINYELIDLTV